MLSCHLHSAMALGSAGAFLALGAAGSGHCLAMCGPLACLLGDPEKTPKTTLGLYHGGRLLAYLSVGFVLASLGRPLQPVLSWPLLALLAGLPLLAYALSPREWVPAWLGRWHRRGAALVIAWPPHRRALALGLLTPALPCGLLYAAAAGAMAAPNPWMGAGWMGAFALGTFPALILGQAGFTWATRHRGPVFAAGLRRGAALMAAVSLIVLAFFA